MTATDAAGNVATQSITWRVDGTPPSVTFAPPSPGIPLYPWTFPVPENSVLRFALTEPDVSTTAPSLTCAIDGGFGGGAVGPCAGGEYGPLDTLSEGRHVFAVTATDCAGNPAQSGNEFHVDLQAPFVAPPLVSLSDAGVGTATFALEASDAATQVAELFCAMDDPGAAAVQGACPLLTMFLQGSAASGTTQYEELASGRHRLRVAATDSFGRTSDPVELTFDLVYPFDGTRGGRAVLVGNDYSGAVGGSLDDVLGKAVFLSPAQRFERATRVVLFSGPGTTPEESANARVAIGTSLSVRAEPDPEFTVVSDPVELPEALLGRDVLVILDQNDPVRSSLLAASASWNDTLRTFGERGGVVVALDGLTPAGLPSETWRAVSGGAQPLFDVTGSLAYDGLVSRVCHTQDPLAEEAGESEPFVGVRFLAGAGAAWLFAQAAPCGESGDCTLPVILGSLLPRPAAGPVAARAWSAGARRDETSSAVFSDFTGAVLASCPLFPDGFAMHDLPASGGSVTIATPGAVPVLETVVDARPYESIVIGATLPVAPMGGLLVEIPSFAGGASFLVANAWSRAIGDASAVVVLEQPTDQGFSLVVVTALDASASPIAYTSVTSSCTAWPCAVSASAFPPFSPSPFLVTIATPGAFPAGTVSVGRRLALEGREVLIDEGLDGTVPFWSPLPSNPFAEAVRVSASLVFAPLSARQPVSTLELERAPPLATGTITVDLGEALARITGVQVVPCAGRACASWTAEDASPSPVTEADFGVLRLASFTCGGAPAEWTLALPPPTGEAGSFTTPALPAELDCAGIDEAEAPFLGYFERGADTPASARRSAWDALERIRGRRAAELRELGERVRQTVSELQ